MMGVAVFHESSLCINRVLAGLQAVVGLPWVPDDQSEAFRLSTCPLLLRPGASPQLSEGKALVFL